MKHYSTGKIQVWDFIIDQRLDFLEGNIIKYICRWKHKDGYKDLIKAKTYIDKLLELHQGKGTPPVPPCPSKKGGD